MFVSDPWLSVAGAIIIVLPPLVASTWNRAGSPKTASVICSPLGSVTIVTIPLRNFSGKTLPLAHDNCAYPGLMLPDAIFAFGLSHGFVYPCAAPTKPPPKTAITHATDIFNFKAFANIIPKSFRFNSQNLETV